MNKLCRIANLIIWVSLFSCRQEGIEEMYLQDNDCIQFTTPTIEVVQEEGTRGVTTEILKKKTLTSGESFNVWGYCVPNMVSSSTSLDYNGAASSWLAKRALSLPNVFYNSGTDFLNTVTVGGEQTGARSRKWYSYSDKGYGLDGKENASVGKDANDYQYTFFAYYPAGDTGFQINNGQYVAKNELNVQYTMPYDDGDEIDLSSTDSYKTNDAMLAMVENHRRGDGKVQFTFSHLLCALNFQCNNFTEYNDYNDLQEGKPTLKGEDIYIKSIRLGGTFHKTLNINLFEGSSSNYSFADSYTAIYTIFSSAEGECIYFKEEEGKATSAVLGNPLLLLCGTRIDGFEKYLGPTPYVNYDGGTNTPLNVTSLRSSSNKGIYLEIVYKAGENVDEITKVFPLLTPNRSFTPYVGVNYTMQLNWLGNNFVLLIMPDGKGTWGDGEADDNSTDNDDVVFE